MVTAKIIEQPTKKMNKIMYNDVQRKKIHYFFFLGGGVTRGGGCYIKIFIFQLKKKIIKQLKLTNFSKTESILKLQKIPFIFQADLTNTHATHKKEKHIKYSQNI